MPFKKGETPKGARPFTKDHRPNNPGRKPGSPNRATLLKRWLDVETVLTNPITKMKEKGFVEDEVVIALIAQARKGNVKAIALILDSVYGKLIERQELSGPDGDPLKVQAEHNYNSSVHQLFKK